MRQGNRDRVQPATDRVTVDQEQGDQHEGHACDQHRDDDSGEIGAGGQLFVDRCLDFEYPAHVTQFPVGLWRVGTAVVTAYAGIGHHQVCDAYPHAGAAATADGLCERLVRCTVDGVPGGSLVVVELATGAIGERVGGVQAQSGALGFQLLAQIMDHRGRQRERIGVVFVIERTGQAPFTEHLGNDVLGVIGTDGLELGNRLLGLFQCSGFGLMLDQDRDIPADRDTDDHHHDDDREKQAPKQGLLHNTAPPQLVNRAAKRKSAYLGC